MIVTDPIADMLTRIRNALTIKKSEVMVPASKTKNSIAEILFNEGYIEKYEMLDTDGYKSIKISLKYGPNGEKVIQGLKRISKPGLRVYSKAEELPTVLNGLGIAIISTSKGIMTDREARKNSLGGEVIAYVW